MNWNSASEFFAMGGYGLYVWGSYLVALAAMSVEPWLAAQRHRRARNQIVDVAAPAQQEGSG
ncbi:MAG: heme exporter protein CcmD [Burkholderiales bacterium]|jgi:heme exporter protein D|nr:heme exporter protein CcmD [Burkholderiales bacterium]